jgi:hypothetical protein
LGLAFVLACAGVLSTRTDSDRSIAAITNGRKFTINPPRWRTQRGIANKHDRSPTQGRVFSRVILFTALQTAASAFSVTPEQSRRLRILGESLQQGILEFLRPPMGN